MHNFPTLSFLIFFPVIGSLFILFFLKKDQKKEIFYYSIIISLINFIFCIKALLSFKKDNLDFQFQERVSLIKGYDINYYIGVDGFSLMMILLTSFLILVALLFSFNSIKERVKEYTICFLLLEAFAIGSFLSLDLLLFYIFFEALLIPMFFIIGIWGGKEKNYAAFKFFLYTFFGSIFFLLSIVYIIVNFETSNILLLKDNALPNLNLQIQTFLWLGFFISFAIKLPMFPFHTWLPDAHVQAPTAGSIILAGILIKLGGYGFLRFSLPFFPEASMLFAPLVFTLSVIAIIYTSIIAFAQTDIKKLIAYSSIAHMGFVTIGIFSFNIVGINGAIIQMISHGIISSSLFLLIGIIYDKLHTREINQFGGLVIKMPLFATFMMIFTLASIGLPGTSGFIGEILSIIGAFQINKLVAIIASFGVVLGAGYMLVLYKRMIFGDISNDKIHYVTDIDKTNCFLLITMSLLVIAIGVYPSFIFSFVSPSIENYLNKLF